MKFEPLEVIENPFYFGIGGVGDFLLLMATFYDDIQPDTTDLIFVCNNVNTIRAISKEFPKIGKTWLFPATAFQKTPENWRLITRHHLFRGSGATPREFRYIEDWIECGKSNVFDYYGLNRSPEWCAADQDEVKPHVTIQPNGGADSNRVSVIGKIELTEIIHRLARTHHVYLIGSQWDADKYGTFEYAQWVTKFDDAFHKIRTAHFHVGVNSWCKTYAGLAGVRVYIYPSTYLVDPMVAYGNKNDPSDYVFMKEAGFPFEDWREYADDRSL